MASAMRDICSNPPISDAYDPPPGWVRRRDRFELHHGSIFVSVRAVPQSHWNGEVAYEVRCPLGEARFRGYRFFHHDVYDEALKCVEQMVSRAVESANSLTALLDSIKQ